MNKIESPHYLRALSMAQLQRLESLLLAVPLSYRGAIDLETLAAEVSNALPSTLGGDKEWRSEVSGGRHYELMLLARNTDCEAADKQYASEWSRVDAMIAAGTHNFESAWAEVRRDNWRIQMESLTWARTDANDLEPSSEDHRRAVSRLPPVERYSPKARRDGAPTPRWTDDDDT